MVLPIVVYGDPVLRKMGADIDKNYEGLNELIANMFETMYHAKGVGLAAPQIGKAIRLFVIDASPFGEVDEEDEDEEEEKLSEKEIKFLKNFKRVFINARILEEKGGEWKFNEGCLSIPKIREDVLRKSTITIEYYDASFKKHTEVIDGLAARVVQHEYDHIEGKLFTDRISAFKRKLLAGKLTDISKGKFSTDYKTKVYQAKK
ncbi:MAG TPA: peptide deformylase [Bacteroidia bacterium]|jgi:peptide deformylase|nr:peptide deformylase [Bacteroidia bacterium]